MIDPQQWVSAAIKGLEGVFGPRLLYVGLQGSYQRGEATENSDIDLVALLDAVSLDDLDAYRAVVRALPEGEKACGFICGAAEFAHWPRHELFPFKMDTRDYHGRLDDFMPPVERADIALGVKISASGLMHFLTHSWLYADPEARSQILREAYKSAFFVMRVVHYLKTGTYPAAKKELAAALDGPEREIILAGQDFAAWSGGRAEKSAFDLLMAWCRELLVS